MNKKTKTYLIHGGLFLATLITTTIAGAEWRHGKFVLYGMLGWTELKDGLTFSIPFLLIFTFHEFGHYFTARINNVKASLPYYIPLPPIPGMIGTLGAVIRLKETVQTTRKNFDIGIAGPLAGFVIALLVLTYGYSTLPDKDYVLEIHPEYEYFGENYDQFVYSQDTIVSKQMIIDAGIMTQEELKDYPDTVFAPYYSGSIMKVDKTWMIQLFEKYMVPEEDKAKIPNAYELVHYPILFAGFLALFFTALNLLPIGQLDGGHVVYGLFGQKGHSIIAYIIFFGLLFFGGIGIVNPGFELVDIILWGFGLAFIYYYLLGATGLPQRDRIMYAVAIFTLQFLFVTWFPQLQANPLLLVLSIMVRVFVGVKHPPSIVEEKLDTNRIVLGWLSLIILILCFTPTPFITS